ncbi:MAG: flagellar filament capping protein FliD [Candidatus Izemoplasmatales bacterium]|nr:flagellar filament capping protein FliD [Candidatus Izemoplasmatales bacterium]
MSTLRIGGLASGMDTETIISTMLESRQAEVDRVQAQVDTYTEKYASWSELSTRLGDLRSVTGDLTSYTTWNQKTVTSSNSSYVTATTTSTAAADYEIFIDYLAKAHRIASDAQTSITSELSLSGDFVVGGETVTLEAADTLEDVVDKINSAASSMDAEEKVKAYIVGKQLVVERAATGDTDISITDGATGVLKSLGVLNPDESIKNEIQEARDLSVTINGVAYTGSSNTGVTDAVSGVTFNFLKAMTVGSTETISIENDTATIKSLLTDFITNYNDTMDYIQTQSTVQISSDSSQVTATGILQGDTLLSSMFIRFRSIASSIETNPNYRNQNFNSLYKIGIGFAGEDNQLSILDEAKLDDALENNFDDVMELMRSWGEDVGGETKGAGIMRQMDDYIYSLTDPISGSVTLRQQSIEDMISYDENKIYSLNQDMSDYETQLWEHFANMESMISEMNSQINYLMSALGQTG